MDRNIHKNLVDGITLTNNNDPLEGLFNFLDSQIEILSFYLYSELFKKILRKSWNSVVDVCIS